MLLTDGVPPRRYDCFIVGSGPAGVSLALELVKARRSVLIFESGGNKQVRRELANTIGYGHYSGNYWNRHWVRALGGTSNAWTGWCAPWSAGDFDNPSIGVRWPIGHADLLPYYAQAAEVLDRHPSTISFEKTLFAGFQYRPFSLAAPTRFGEKYLDALSGSSVDVALGCSIVGLEANEARSVVRRMHYVHHPSGTRREVDVAPAQPIVLAAGGIGNAQLFLQPPEAGEVSVGNESGLAGKFVMEHPHLYGAGECVIDVDFDTDSPPPEFGQSAHALIVDRPLMRERRLFGCSLNLHTKSANHEAAQFFSRELGRPCYHYRVDIRAEMLPSASNHVFLTGERDRAGLHRLGVRCVIDAKDLLNAEMTLRTLGAALIQLGRGRVRIVNDRIYRNPTGGGHTMGTTRMGTTPSTSVVDADCRVHGYRNLFVAGSSVFPTSGWANPTLTIVALSLRLASRLVKES